jgi:hypothetical protein
VTATNDAAIEKARGVLEQVSANPVAIGEAREEAAGKQAAVVERCEVRGIHSSAEQRESLPAMTVSELDALRATIKRERRWPQ